MGLLARINGNLRKKKVASASLDSVLPWPYEIRNNWELQRNLYGNWDWKLKQKKSKS